ncbi:ThuA domain-containing protein [Chryseolinea sp. T2]|uniref:ThuA domain-containing protein n=1 Tax=Chryseolinea sp. T2 TaxID=3129255 RepID=UPI00307813E3
MNIFTFMQAHPRITLSIFACLLILSSCRQARENANENHKLKALIIDGQSNHGVWPKTTAMMKDYLEQTGLFTVDVTRTALTWQGPHSDNDVTLGKDRREGLLLAYPIAGLPPTTVVEKAQPDPDFHPDFSNYDVVISNFGWQAAPWPKETQTALEMFVSGGGGLVVIHAADNSFGDWEQFNKMIGMGAWGDRNEKTGPYVYYDKQGNLVRDTTAGAAGSHGKQYPFLITMRDTVHAITKGMPTEWLHAQDELYDRLRGPAQNMDILATAFSDVLANDSPFSDFKGTDRNEPMAMTIAYGNGRVFHTPLGHADYSWECVGLITLFQRACEWAATGKVTTPIPSDFPTADSVHTRKWNH